MFNFNINPYFDDFSRKKHYYKVLFKPELLIQARELNTIQSIFYNQLKNFANNIFKNGSRVSNGRVSIVKYDSIKINSPRKLKAKEGYYVLGEYSRQIARFIMQFNDIILVEFQGTDYTGKKQNFRQGEPITIRTQDELITDNTQIINHPKFRDIGNVLVVDEGVFYYQGYFIKTERQIILFDPLIDSQIGFEVKERFVTSIDDKRLLDNNAFSPNYLKPGADRYEIKLQLIQKQIDKQEANQSQSLSLENENDNGFIVLAQIRNGKVQLIKSDSEYNELGDMIAQRTYEESGNYIVKNFKLTVKNHKAKNKNDDNGIDTNGDESNYVAILGPGIGYIKGYRVETQEDFYLIGKKARNTKKISDSMDFFVERSYFKAIPVQGSSNYPLSSEAINYGYTYDNNMTVNFYDGELDQTNYLPTGNIIGKAEVIDVAFDSIDQNGDKVYRYYIKNIQFEQGKSVQDIKSIVRLESNFRAKSFIDEILNKPTIYNPERTELIWELNKKYVKSLKDIDNPDKNSITLVLRKKLSGTLTINDNVCQTIFEIKTNEIFMPYNYSTIALLDDNGVLKTINFENGNTIDISPEKIIIKLNDVSLAGKQIHLITNVLVINASEKTKTIESDSCKDNNGNDYLDIKDNIGDPVDKIPETIILPHSDIINFKAYVYDIGVPIDLQQPIDVTDLFYLDNGVKDSYYTNGIIYRKKNGNELVPIPLPNEFDPISHKLKIEYTYFKHSLNGTFFNADSYKLVPYDLIPKYIAKNKKEYNLTDCIDFRPLLLMNNQTQNLEAKGEIELPSFNQPFFFDIEYYVGRVDSIVIDKNKELKIIQGTPKENPTPPELNDDYMILYNLWLSPYTFTLNDIKIEKINNRRYTMKDIGEIDERLRNVEYYTTLTMLEKQIAEMNIKDVNGNDRYKNGFVVDDFSGFGVSDLLSGEFRASIDPKHHELRPKFTMKNKKLVVDFNRCKNIKVINNIAYLPFVDELADEQPLASRNISINPYYMVSKKGNVTLKPNNDFWSDVNTLPVKQVTIDTGMHQSLKNMLKFSGYDVVFGSWSLLNQNIINQNINDIENNAFRKVEFNNTNAKITTYNAGIRVKNINTIPFMRSIEIEFIAENMAKNTRIYAFFDGKPISQYCRPINGIFGEPLITDNEGKLRGIFKVPEGIFFTGRKTFELSGDPLNEKNVDTELTYAKAIFFAGGIHVDKEQLNLNVITPEFNSNTIIESSQRTDIHDSEEIITFPTPDINSLPPALPTISPRPTCCKDPVAQSFMLFNDSFITAVGIYMKSIDMSSSGIFVQIRTMKNGYPTNEILANKFLTSQEVQPFVSDDASIELKVNFTYPVFVKGNTEYCFVVGGDSPKSRIWVARLGDKDISDPNKIIEKQASIGSSFRSQNGTTWNAEQYEDIKYRIYTAKFTEKEMHLIFIDDKTNEFEKLEKDPFECEKGEKLIRVYAKNHGLSKGDIVTISTLTDHEFTINSSIMPMIGQKITTSTGSAIINDIKTSDHPNEYIIKVREMQGVLVQKSRDFNENEINQMITNIPFVCESELINNIVAPHVEGTINGIRAPITKISGIELNELNKDLIVKNVDSKDSFIIETNNISTNSGRFGGTNVEIIMNQRFEIFNCSGHYEKYTCDEQWEMITTDFNNKILRQNIVLKADYHLDRSCKLLSSKNKTHQGFEIIGKFTSDNEKISPVINLDTFSIVLIANSIDSLNPESINQKPNGRKFFEETDPTQGSHSYKYVTRKITLSKPANDLRIMFEVYKDTSSDFEVYIKTLGQYSSENIDKINWIKIPIDKPKNQTSNFNVFEYDFDCSQQLGYNLNEFISFKVKIVGKTNNPAKPPLFKNLRIIAHS